MIQSPRLAQDLASYVHESSVSRSHLSWLIMIYKRAVRSDVAQTYIWRGHYEDPSSSMLALWE